MKVSCLRKNNQYNNSSLALILFFITFLFTFNAFGEILLFDDFSDGSLNNPPESVNNPIWENRVPGWGWPTIIDDGTGNMVIKHKALSLSAGSEEWTDYTTEVRFRFLRESEGGNPEIFRCFNIRPRVIDGSDAANWQGMIYKDPKDNSVYFKIVRSVDHLQPIAIKFGDDLSVFGYEWHTFAVQVIGNQMTLFFNGEEVKGSRTILDDESCPFNPRGNIAIYMDKVVGTPADPYMLIDYIKVTDDALKIFL